MPPDDQRFSPAVREKRESVSTAEIATFYKAEMPRLVLFVMTVSSSLDSHAAADVAQTAFERALPRWPALHDPKAWLYRVAQNEALTRAAALSWEIPEEALPDRPDQISVALIAELRDEQRAAMAALQRLAPKQRQVMTWTVAGFSDAEIADSLGLTADAVRQNRREARKNLRRALEARRDAS